MPGWRGQQGWSVAGIVIPPTIPAPKGFVAKGDSLTYGQNSDSQRAYPDDLSRNVGVKLVKNWAVSGQDVATANANYPSEGGTSYNSATADTYLFMMGTNDANGGDATTVLSRIQTHINLALATGYRVALGTIPKRGDNASTQTVLNSVNASLRANWQSMGATWLMDFDIWSTLQNPNDTTYYSTDKLHLTNAGYLEVAKAAQAGLAIPSLSARGSNGALRFRPNPPSWRVATVAPTYNVVTMQTVTMPDTGGGAILVNPITAKSVFAFSISNIGDGFTAVGIYTDADGDNNIGFGPGAASGIGYYSNGGVYQAGSNAGGADAGYTTGVTVGVIVDPIAKKIWWTRDGSTFFGVGGPATLAQVIAGTNTVVQGWTGNVYGVFGMFGGGGTPAVASSIPYPWTLPSGYTQL